MAKDTAPGALLTGSTLGLVGGIFLIISGRAIMDSVAQGSYETVLGIVVIKSSLEVIGIAVSGFSLLGIMFGVWSKVK